MPRPGWRAVVINLPRRADRLEAFRESYARSGWAGVLGEPLVLQAVDGDIVRRPLKWTGYAPGTWGCYRSHLLAIGSAVADNLEELIVFEDDAVFPPDSSVALARFLLDVASLDAVWLGGEHAEHQQVLGTYRPVSQVFRTHAYMLSRKALRAVYPQLATSVGQIDLLLTKALTGTNVYTPEPMMVGQSAGRSDITGVVEPERFWNGPVFADVVHHVPPPPDAPVKTYLQAVPAYARVAIDLRLSIGAKAPA